MKKNDPTNTTASAPQTANNSTVEGVSGGREEVTLHNKSIPAPVVSGRERGRKEGDNTEKKRVKEGKEG